MYRKHYVQFLQEDLERHFPQFFLPEFARIVRPGIQLLRESLVLYPSNVFECWIGRDRRHPWRSSKPTVVNKLTPNQLDISTPFDSKHYYMFARNTSTLSAAHSVAEGFIRPSASDPNDSSWTTTNSFYACGQHITDITGPHIREVELCWWLPKSMVELVHLYPWQLLAAHLVDTIIFADNVTLGMHQ